MILFGGILCTFLYKTTLEISNESKGIYNYNERYLQDLVLSMLIVVYACVFSVVVFIKTRKK